MTLQSGRTGRATRTVAQSDTAIALGSGDVPVLGTPAVVALVERACCAAVEGALPEGSTSVGVRVELDHLAPSHVGATVEATATLTEVEGRGLTFTATVVDGDEVVARAVHRRAIVDRARFQARLDERG
ncbi:MAG: thioesterase family protein [Actinomycetota bacterium]